MGEDDAVLADDGGAAHVSAVAVEPIPRKTRIHYKLISSEKVITFNILELDYLAIF